MTPSQSNSKSNLGPRKMFSGFSAALLIFLFYMWIQFSRGRISDGGDFTRGEEEEFSGGEFSAEDELPAWIIFLNYSCK
jgi:hypothetical protein